jgi:hypothetical protein
MSLEPASKEPAKGKPCILLKKDRILVDASFKRQKYSHRPGTSYDYQYVKGENKKALWLNSEVKNLSASLKQVSSVSISSAQLKPAIATKVEPYIAVLTPKQAPPSNFSHKIDVELELHKRFTFFQQFEELAFLSNESSSLFHQLYGQQHTLYFGSKREQGLFHCVSELVMQPIESPLA